MSGTQESERVAQPAEGAAVEATTSPAAPEPLPIGGLLRIFGVFLPLVTLAAFVKVAPRLEGLMKVAGSASVSDRSPSLVPTAVDLASVLAWLFVTIKFFERRRYVPLLIIGVSLVRGAQVIGWGPEIFPPRSVALTFLAVAIFASYFSLSTRVKRTFLR